MNGILTGINLSTIRVKEIGSHISWTLSPSIQKKVHEDFSLHSDWAGRGDCPRVSCSFFLIMIMTAARAA